MPTYLDYGGISGISGGSSKSGGASPKKPRRRAGSAGGNRPRSQPAPRPSPRLQPSPPPRSGAMPGGGSFPGGGGGGGGGGRNRAQPPRRPPSIKSYLAGDDVYQGARRGATRSLRDFLSELNRRRGEATTTFGQTKSTMEADRVRQLDKLREEFASRGLIQSGLYGQEQGTFQEQFAQQMQALQQQQAALMSDLLSQRKNYERENQLAMELARQEALQRRAERYRLT
jgi:hypothetical protein